MPGEWWDSDTGQNMLAGVEGDVDNPPLLPSDYIIAFLQKIPAARSSLKRMVGNMLPEEQDRLLSLLATAEANPVVDPTMLADQFQLDWNRQGVLTTGRYGGTRRGGNR